MQLVDLRASKIKKLIYVHRTFRSLNRPKALAQFFEKSLKRKHTLLKITRYGVGTNPRYMMVAV